MNGATFQQSMPGWHLLGAFLLEISCDKINTIPFLMVDNICITPTPPPPPQKRESNVSACGWETEFYFLGICQMNKVTFNLTDEIKYQVLFLSLHTYKQDFSFSNCNISGKLPFGAYVQLLHCLVDIRPETSCAPGIY